MPQNILTAGNTAVPAAIAGGDDGTFVLVVGAAGSPVNALSANATGQLTFTKLPVNPVQSMIRLGLANGYGSTNTVIRRFSNVLSTQGTDITYADSATLGASFTINVAGVYAVSYSDQFSADSWAGLSLNTTQPAVTIRLVAPPEMLSASYQAATGAGVSSSVCQYFLAGAVIRAHAMGIATGPNTAACQLTITRVA